MTHIILGAYLDTHGSLHHALGSYLINIYSNFASFGLGLPSAGRGRGGPAVRAGRVPSSRVGCANRIDYWPGAPWLTPPPQTCFSRKVIKTVFFLFKQTRRAPESYLSTRPGDSGGLLYDITALQIRENGQF